MRFRILLCTLLLTVVPLSAGTVAAQEEAARFQRAFERLDEFIAGHMRESNTPGLALALTSRDELLRVSTYGFADRKARLPVRPETLFEIGSITKSFTAIALLQLRQEGRLDLHTPLTAYLPWFHINSDYDPISAHDVLTHTAGLPRDRDDIPSSLYQAAGVRERSTGYAPGARFAYSNVGYQILGYLLEELEQQPYPDIIRRRIFQPLGMTASEAAITHSTRARLAVGYVPLYDDRPRHRFHPLVEATWLEYGAGDGSIAATPADLAAYLRMLLNRGAGSHGRILSEESFALLIQRAAKTGEEEAYYGYGLNIREAEGHTLISHAGGMVGYSAMLLGDLDEGLGAVVFLNGPGNGERVAEFALKVMRAALHAQELPPLPAPEPPTNGAKAADYAGVYTTASGKELVLVADGQRLLLLHRGVEIPLEHRGKDSFIVNHPDFALFLLRFGRDKDDQVAEAMHGPDWYANE
ncbi:MAG: serine hydrolase domain-containing protein, partial [Terriglobia bacterium]